MATIEREGGLKRLKESVVQGDAMRGGERRERSKGAR